MPAARFSPRFLLFLLLLSPTSTAGGSSGSLLPLPRGNWVVRGPVVLADVDITLRGDLIVKRGGSLDLRGVALRMEGHRDGSRRIRIEPGGRFSTGPSPVTRRRSAISRGETAGRFGFEVAAGSDLHLVSTTVSGAGWSADEPGLRVRGVSELADGPTIADCEFRENFVGLTLIGTAAEVVASRFGGNERAGLVAERSTVSLNLVELRDQPVGLAVGAASVATIAHSLFERNEVAVWSRGRSLDLGQSLFLGNGRHVWLEGSGTARLHDNLFAAASGNAVTASEGSAPLLRANDFVFNAIGVRNDNVGGVPVADAAGNYWGHESGPAGAGSGRGDPVSEGVLYSPWCEASCRRGAGAS